MSDDIVNLSALVVLREMSGFALGRRSGHGHGYERCVEEPGFAAVREAANSRRAGDAAANNVKNFHDYFEG